jgi:tetratricopeptide (TPR) repeat protein
MININVMKRSVLKYVLIGITFSLQLSIASAQCDDWKWPEDKAKAEEKNVLYTDALRVSDFAAAKKPHLWLLQNAPDLNTAIYINGEKIYKGLMESTKDEAQQQIYFDSLIMMYDMRVKYCGEEESVIVREAYETYKQNAKKVSELENMLNLFDRAYDLKGNDLDYYVILPYMSTVVNNVKYVKKLTEEQILERYDKIMSVIDFNISQGINEDRWRGYKSTVDGMLVSVVNVDCDFVRKNMAPKFKEDPSDLKLAKKIFGFMLNGKCTDDPLWLEAGKKIQEKEPEFGLAKNIGLKLKGVNNAEAEKYFNQAITLTEDPGNKADMYMQLGTMKSGSTARDYYRKALAADPTKREAYAAIGYLYYQSFESCAGKADIVKDRATFLAAYDMFERAGNSKMMEAAKEQFPSKEEIFTYNYNSGDNLSVGCWIGESTVIRTRD